MKIAANRYETAITAKMLKEMSNNAGVYLLLDKDFANIREIKRLAFQILEKSMPSYEFSWDFETDNEVDTKLQPPTNP